MTYVAGDTFDYWMRVVAALGNVGTAAGVIVAVVSFLRTRRSDREAREEQNRLAAERNYLDMASHALHVVHRAEYDHDTVRTTQDQHVRVIVTVENRGPDPIYDLVFLPQSPLGPPYWQHQEYEPKVHILAAGQEHREAIVVHATNSVQSLPRRPLVTLDFTDGNNIRWRRPSFSKPIEAPAEEAQVSWFYTPSD